MKKILFTFLLLSSIVSAQINESDSINVKAKLSITGFLQKGNVETWIFRAKSDFSFKPSESFVFKTQNSYVYQEFGEKKADEDFLSLNFLYLNPDKRFYPLVLAFVSTNFRREIDLRYLIGAGVTYQVINKKDNWLKIALSSEYENTNFSNTNFTNSSFNGNDVISTIRGTFWMNGKYSLFKKKMILTHEVFFQPSLKDKKNFRWQADLGLELPVWKYLNLKFNYLRTFESIVVENQKEEDTILSFGFTLKSF